MSIKLTSHRPFRASRASKPFKRPSSKRSANTTKKLSKKLVKKRFNAPSKAISPRLVSRLRPRKRLQQQKTSSKPKAHHASKQKVQKIQKIQKIQKMHKTNKQLTRQVQQAKRLRAGDTGKCQLQTPSGFVEHAEQVISKGRKFLEYFKLVKPQHEMSVKAYHKQNKLNWKKLTGLEMTKLALPDMLTLKHTRSNTFIPKELLVLQTCEVYNHQGRLLKVTFAFNSLHVARQAAVASCAAIKLSSQNMCTLPVVVNPVTQSVFSTQALEMFQQALKDGLTLINQSLIARGLQVIGSSVRNTLQGMKVLDLYIPKWLLKLFAITTIRTLFVGQAQLYFACLGVAASALHGALNPIKDQNFDERSAREDAVALKLLITLSGYKPLISIIKNAKYVKDGLRDINNTVKVSTEWLLKSKIEDDPEYMTFDVERAKHLNTVESERAAFLPLEPEEYNAATWKRIQSICDSFHQPKCWQSYYIKVAESLFSQKFSAPEPGYSSKS